MSEKGEAEYVRRMESRIPGEFREEVVARMRVEGKGRKRKKYKPTGNKQIKLT